MDSKSTSGASRSRYDLMQIVSNASSRSSSRNCQGGLYFWLGRNRHKRNGLGAEAVLRKRLETRYTYAMLREGVFFKSFEIVIFLFLRAGAEAVTMFRTMSGFCLVIAVKTFADSSAARDSISAACLPAKTRWNASI